MGNTKPRPIPKTQETLPTAGSPIERMTRFELATLTLAKKKGYDDRPHGPSSALQYSTVRTTVRPVRLSRPVRIPLYHHTRAMYLQLIKHLPNDHSACAMIVFMR